MEREILFRGKRLDNDAWVYGCLLVYADGSCFICREYRPGKFNKLQVDPATVGQYVGMPDKNGTKIFDGDLLKYTGYEDDTPYRVFWKHTGWYIQYENRQPESLGISLPEDWEIIGNIYDNPELLEVTK